MVKLNVRMFRTSAFRRTLGWNSQSPRMGESCIVCTLIWAMPADEPRTKVGGSYCMALLVVDFIKQIYPFLASP